MGCCGDREKFGSASNEQKWDYIVSEHIFHRSPFTDCIFQNLSDFRSTSCWSPLSYGVVYIFLVISVGVYAVDLFTAANLLFFDRWSSQVKPAIPFEISRWVFAGCIILSWILLGYRWWRAIRAIRTGVITASYLDPLAVRVQSVRTGQNGRGWRRFLVFAALTKGRKGSEYVALFTYFSFEGKSQKHCMLSCHLPCVAWLRICFAEGPRQVINALTLYSVMRADLLPAGVHRASDGHTPVVQFFVNVQILAQHNNQQAAILFGMLYTLVIWVISAISLILAFIMYITFLWHYIPSADGSLTHFCRRKIESRLHKIVMDRVNKALAKDRKAKAKQAKEDAKAGIARVASKRQPTVPVLETDMDIPPPLSSRADTQPEFSPFDSRPASPYSGKSNNKVNALQKEPTVPDVFGTTQRPGMPSRSTTHSSIRSNTSYGSDAPLISSAGEMGRESQSRSGSRNESIRTRSERSLHSARPPPTRNYTGNSHSTQRSLMSTPSRFDPASENDTVLSGRSLAPNPSRPQGRKPMPFNPHFNAVGRSIGGGTVGAPSQPLSPQEFEMYPPGPNGSMSRPLRNGPYAPFNQGAVRGPAGPYSMRGSAQTQRPPPGDYFGESRVPPRAGTAPIPQQTGGYDDSIYDAYGASSQVVPFRPATAGPGTGGRNGPRRPMPPQF